MKTKTIQKGSVLGFDALWQMPAKTEKHAYDLVLAKNWSFSSTLYVGFPWANMIDDNTLILFRKNQNIVMRGVCSFKVINESLAESLWGIDFNDNETWPLIYFITKIQKIALKADEINACLGYSNEYNWQGLNIVKGKIADYCIKKFIAQIKERRI